MFDSLFSHFSRWSRLPLATLLLLLQRTPVLRLLTEGTAGTVLSRPAEVAKGLFASVLALGAVNSLAGASGGATNGTVSGVPGSPLAATKDVSLQAAFTIKGALASPGSWSISAGTLPSGCYLASSRTDTSGITSGFLNVSNTTVYVLGTPRATGTFNFTVAAWQNANGGGGSSTVNYSIKVSAGVATAVSITTQPASQSLFEGDALTLSVGVSGTSPYTYQWKKDGTAISGATSATYALTSVKVADSGTYTVTVGNSVGSVTSSGANVSITAPPKIVTAPVAQTAIVGNPASFSVTATGTAPLAYQWYLDGGSIAGATASTYSISSVSVLDGGEYSVKVTGPAASVTSTPVLLIVQTRPAFTKLPSATTVNEGAALSLSVSASGTSPLSYQWYKNGVAIAGATSATYSVASTSSADAGNYTVKITNPTGSLTSDPVEVAITPAIRFTTQPLSQTSPAASNVELSAAVQSLTPATFQWKKDGTAISGATSDHLALANLGVADAGIYTVAATAGAYTLESRPAQIVVDTLNPGRLINMSVRSVAGVNGNPLIVGFNVSNGSKDVLVRVDGPVLIDPAFFNISTALRDPLMAVHGDLGSGDVILQSNDNWGDGGLAATLAETFAKLGAFGWSDTTSKDAALIATMSGNRTIHVNSAVTGQSGVVLVEAYDAGTGTTQRLSNVSARNEAGSGEQSLIVGFVIDGNAPKPMLVRAVGPTLSLFGVTTYMKNPKIELHRSINGVDTIFAVNDNWSDEPGLSSAVFADFGAFGLGAASKDAALLVTLPPGQYTAVASSADGGTGEVIIEAYEHL